MQPYETLFTSTAISRVRLWQLRTTYPAVLVLVLLLAAVIALWWLVRTSIRAEQEATFERAVSSVMSRLERQVSQHEQVLRSVQGLYGHFVQVVRDVFELYATVPARDMAAVLSIAYAPCVDSARLSSYVHYARSERYWHYRIFPAVTQPRLFPLLYVVPPQEAERRTGWNALTDPAWRASIERAYRQGVIAATPWIPLRTEPDTVWGIALVVPIYRTTPHPFTELRVGDRFLEGIIILELAGDRFFQQALAATAPTDSLIVFEGFDWHPTASGEMRRVRVAVSPNWNAALLSAPALQTERVLRLGDRTLRFHFATVPHFVGRFQRWAPWLVLGGGVAMSMIAFGFVLSLVTTRARALALAERMTRAQRRILQASHDIIAVWEPDGRWRTANPALRSMLGYEPEALAGQAVEATVAAPARQGFRTLLASLPDEEATLVELPMLTAAGQVRWVGWNLTLSRHDGALYAIGRDITAQKELERQQELARRQLVLAEQWALEASEFQAEFLNHLSFQLRNGLTGLMGFAELLAQQDLSEEERQSYSAALQESAEYLLGIVAAAPEVATTALERHPVRLVPVLAELSVWAHHHGQQLSLPDLEGDVAVIAEETLLHKALQAILQGFSAAGVRGTIWLRIECDRAAGASEWSISAPSTEALCRSAATLKEYPPVRVVAIDDSETTFAFLLAQAFIRRLRGELRVECIDDSAVVFLTLPMSRQVQAVPRLAAAK